MLRFEVPLSENKFKKSLIRSLSTLHSSISSNCLCGSQYSTTMSDTAADTQAPAPVVDAPAADPVAAPAEEATHTFFVHPI
jgi:hypothetical protein